MKQETNDKILAMYQAVSELMEEGQDVHKLKVSDITSRAGIGKGTAYEYFRTKEELVAKAMQYGCQSQYESLAEKISRQKNFRGAFEICLSWWEEKKDKKCFAMEMIKRTIQEKIIIDMVKLGKNEGVINRKIPDELAGLQILSQIVGYCIYREFSVKQNKEEISETKKFLYDTIEKSLK